MLTSAVCEYCWGHGKERGPMHDAPGSDGANAIGRGGTALGGGFAGRAHQHHRKIQSGLWEGLVYPCLQRWRHACTAPPAVVIDPGAGQRAVDNPCS